MIRVSLKRGARGFLIHYGNDKILHSNNENEKMPYLLAENPIPSSLFGSNQKPLCTPLLTVISNLN